MNNCVFICINVKSIHINPSLLCNTGFGLCVCACGETQKMKRDRNTDWDRLPVGHGPLSYLYGAELLVVCAWQAEAAFLPVASTAARAEPVRRGGQRGRTRARLFQHRDLHTVRLKRRLVHKLVIL